MEATNTTEATTEAPPRRKLGPIRVPAVGERVIYVPADHEPECTARVLAHVKGNNGWRLRLAARNGDVSARCDYSREGKPHSWRLLGEK